MISTRTIAVLSLLPTLTLSLGLSSGYSEEPSRATAGDRPAPSVEAASAFRLQAEDRKRVLDKLETALTEKYLSADLGEKMAGLLRKNLDQGKYDAIESPDALARTLTRDLFEVARDRHLDVFCTLKKSKTYQAEAASETKHSRGRPEGASQNYGFEKLERLPGNIGYLDLRGFWSGDAATKTAAAAMEFLENSAAIIIDLRENSGGRPSTLTFLASYFFPRGQRVHLFDVRTRGRPAPEQYWTDENVPAPRLGNIDIYLLTSCRTFSAGEGLAYFLQAHKRAVVVGEASGGGANPAGAPVEIDEHFAAVIPNIQISSPLTGGNWEGSGVKPDIDVAPERALKTAHLLALERLYKDTVPDAEAKGAMTALEREIRSTSK